MGGASPVRHIGLRIRLTLLGAPGSFPFERSSELVFPQMSPILSTSRKGDPCTSSGTGRQIAARKREYVSAVRACVDQVAPDRDPADRRVATFALFGMMNWIHTWYRPEKDVSVDGAMTHSRTGRA